MSSSDPKPPVRMRRRPVPPPLETDEPQSTDQMSSSQRLTANAPEAPSKRRLPNSVSFKKGEPSRNPKGRPRGAKGVKAMARKVLLEPVKIRMPSGQKNVPVFLALLLQERDLAFQKDWRARKTMLEIGRWALPEDVLEEAGVSPVTDPETDRAIIAWFEEEIRLKELQKKRKKDEDSD